MRWAILAAIVIMVIITLAITVGAVLFPSPITTICAAYCIGQTTFSSWQLVDAWEWL